jgi:hypothetical protein
MTNVSPFMVITAIPMDCPYPPHSMFGSIADHDRPYAEYGHLSMCITTTTSFSNQIFVISILIIRLYL